MVDVEDGDVETARSVEELGRDVRQPHKYRRTQGKVGAVEEEQAPVPDDLADALFVALPTAGPDDDARPRVNGGDGFDQAGYRVGVGEVYYDLGLGQGRFCRRSEIGLGTFAVDRADDGDVGVGFGISAYQRPHLPQPVDDQLYRRHGVTS